jgi:DNA modification methylase
MLGEIKYSADKLEKRNVSELIPYVNNARTHSEKQIKQIQKSIKKFGFVMPLLIDSANNIIAGHGRLKAAEGLGYEQVPVLIADGWTEQERKAYVLADNKLAENAGWDADILSSELDSLSLEGFDLDIIGFDLKEEVIGAIEDDEVPDVKEPRSARGDVWRLGEHVVMCGDSTSMQDVATLMDGLQADLLLTDPPYNVAYEGKTKEALKIKNDSMDDSSFLSFLADAFKSADSVMREGASYYIWHAESEVFNFRGACRSAGWQVRQCLIWVKSSMVMGRQDYHWKHEPCLYGWKEGAAHLWNSDRAQTTVLNFDRPSKNLEHPTMKPVDLMSYQIGNNTKDGDIVLDLFGGSGSTLIACEKLGRACRMMELDPKYVDVIIARWEAFTGLKAEKVNA